MEVWVCAHVYFLCGGEWEEADAASRESNLLTTVIKYDTHKKNEHRAKSDAVRGGACVKCHIERSFLYSQLLYFALLVS